MTMNIVITIGTVFKALKATTAIYIYIYVYIVFAQYGSKTPCNAILCRSHTDCWVQAMAILAGGGGGYTPTPAVPASKAAAKAAPLAA